MEQIPFIKMHGLGNDFVVIDGRENKPDLSVNALQAIADRHRGVGYDQLIVLEPTAADADVFMRIYNADGSESEACGNATRCIVNMMMDETSKKAVVVETLGGLLRGTRNTDGVIVVNMGKPSLEWQRIPLAYEQDTAHVEVSAGPLTDPVCVNMGNPHAVFFVEDAEEIDLEKWGPLLENDSIFPERANISVASKMPNGDFRLRVWERGVGITLACGSAACATIVAANIRGLCGRSTRLHLNGGPLDMRIDELGDVYMGGAIATSFTGYLDPALLQGNHNG
jgi:diaminopimelate epimerase